MFFKYCDYLVNVCSSEDVISFNTQYRRRKYLEYLKREGSNEKRPAKRSLIQNSMVGAAGFELATPCTPCKCATRLRYAPT